MKRIGIAQIIQESNSFTPKRATLSDFEPFGIALGMRWSADTATVMKQGGAPMA